MRGSRLVLAILTFLFVSGTYAQSANKTSYGVLFDNTGSMRQLIPRQQEIARAIIKQAKDRATVSIFGFVTTSENPPIVSVATGLECSADSEQLSKQIGAIGVVAGKTTLIDAIRSAVERLGNPVAPGCGKPQEKILVVLSDGEDRASGGTAADLFKFIKQSNVKIYVVALLRDLRADAGFITKLPGKKSREFLENLASESSGRIVFPDKKDDPEQIVGKLFGPDYKLPK